MATTSKRAKARTAIRLVSGKGSTRHQRRHSSSAARRIAYEQEQSARYALPVQDAISYDEAVVRNILNDPKGASVADDAYVLASTLSSLSSSMKGLQYRKGIAVGKLLYKAKTAKRAYMYPEESVADLVGFFQSAGHRHVTYAAYPERIQVMMHDRRGPAIGAHLHAFEAGIISGFLSSAMGRYVEIREDSCVNDNDPYCRFSTGRAGDDEPKGTDPDAIDQLAGHIAYNVRFTRSRKAAIKNGYYLLGSAMLFDDAYLDSVKSIMSYLGHSLGERLSREGKPRLSELKYAIRLLNMGKPDVIGVKPLHLRLSFDGASSRRKFVDMSLAFVNGLLSSRMEGDATAEAHTEKGAYVIDIRERT